MTLGSRAQRVQRGAKAIRRAHHAVLESAACIARCVERREDLGRDAPGLAQNRVGGVGRQLAVARHGVAVLDGQHLVQHEALVAQGRGITVHGGALRFP